MRGWKRAGSRLSHTHCAIRPFTESSQAWTSSSAATTSAAVRFGYSSVVIPCRRWIHLTCEVRLPSKQSRRGSATLRQKRRPPPCVNAGSFFPQLDFPGWRRREVSVRKNGANVTTFSSEARHLRADGDIYPDQRAACSTKKANGLPFAFTFCASVYTFTHCRVWAERSTASSTRSFIKPSSKVGCTDLPSTTAFTKSPIACTKLCS